MSISDAEFDAWVEAGMPDKVVLVEQDYLYAFFDGGTGNFIPTVDTLYFATRAFRTAASDTPSSEPYVDVVDQVPTFSRQIDQVTLGGRSQWSFGQLSLKNPEGLLDFMRNLALDGSEMRCYLGAQTWTRADFRHVVSARATGVSAPDTSTIVVGLSDTGILLNSAIATSFIGGTGPNADRTKAVVRGYCHNVEAALSDITDLVYSVADDGSVSPLTAVRDNGVPIADGASISDASPGFAYSAGADTVTATGHGFIDEDVVLFTSTGSTNGLTNNTRYFVANSTVDLFQLTTTRGGSAVNITSAVVVGSHAFVRYNFFDRLDGTITLGHSPAGTVTCDYEGPEASDDDRRAGAIVDALITDYTSLDTESLVAGPHASYPTGGSTDFHLGVVVAQKQNLLDVLDTISASALMFYGFNRTGQFTYGRIGTSVSLTPVMTIADDDIVTFQGIATWNAAPLYSRWNWLYSKNWTPQSSDSLSPILDPETSAYYAGKGVFGSGLNTSTRPPTVGFGGTISYADNTEEWHLTMTASPETETLLSMRDPTAASTEATLWQQTIRGIFKPYGRFVQIDLRLRAFVLELGDAVTLTLSRYGLGNQQAQVVGLDINLITNTVRALLWYRADADVTTQGGWHG